MLKYIFIYHIDRPEGIAQGHAKGKVPFIHNYTYNKQKDKQVRHQEEKMITKVRNLKMNISQLQ